MNLSGGCGRELAKWIINGRPELDMFSYDIRRFNPDLTLNDQWVKDRCIEAYAKNYSIVYPFDESVSGK
jgi:sarcosine dehydrogenase